MAEPISRRYITVAEAAKYAGCDTQSIRRLISAGKLPGYQLGDRRMVRVELSELEELISRIPVPAKSAG